MTVASNPVYDCLVIGAGPAGLLASIYLRRYYRNILLVDAGNSRAKLIQTSHNYPGTQHAISGETILSNLFTQLKKYELEPKKDTIVDIKKLNNYFYSKGNKTVYVSQTILIATGTCNMEPVFPNIKSPIANLYISHCLICDGFEATNKKIAVIGHDKIAVDEAIALKTYSDKITILTNNEPLGISATKKRKLTECQISYVDDAILEAIVDDNKICGFRFADRTLYFDVVYNGLGSCANSACTKNLKLKYDANGCIYTNSHQCTRVPGVYAAGDVTVGLDQISVAYGQAAIAATSIHQYLKDI